MTQFAEAARSAWPIAARLLGWRPDDFWNATPAELAGALAEPMGVGSPARDQIEALMTRFPDDTRSGR